MKSLVPLIGLWALGLTDQCYEVKKAADVVETQCSRDSQTSTGRVAICKLGSGGKIQIFKTRALCESASVARQEAAPRLESAPGRAQRIPTH